MEPVSPSKVSVFERSFGQVTTSVLAEVLFFFCDVEELCKHFFNVNKQWYQAYRRHLNVRIFLLSEEAKNFEEMNCEVVASIREKRLQYYADYEIDPPSKELAVELLDSFTVRDITSLKMI